MKSISRSDLIELQEAIFKDYGIKMEEKELYDVAFNLLQFIEGLIKYDKQDKLAKKGNGEVRESF